MGLGYDALALYRGDSYRITDKLCVRQPTLGEICDFGEDKYLQMLSTVLVHPFDMIGQLTKMGIDFTEIGEFELFCLMMSTLKPEQTSILFGDVNFYQMETFKLKDSDDIIAVTADKSVIINRYNYMMLVDFLRKLHGFSPPQYNKVGNEYAKQEMIKEALEELEHPTTRKKHKSLFVPLISSLVNYSGFKYNLDTVWNLKLYQFFDAVRRIGALEQSSHLFTGIYSGCIEAKNVKKELDWMREL